MSADTSVPKQREAGLGEFESRLPDAMLRDASVGMAFFDTSLRFVWVNPVLASMYDRTPDDFAGQPAAAVWPPADAAMADAALQQLFTQGSPATETFGAGAAAPPGTASSQRTFHWFGVHGRDQPERGRGDARPADRPAERRGAAHGTAAAGDGDASRGA